MNTVELAFGLAVGMLFGMALVYWADRQARATLDQYCTMQLWLVEDAFRRR